MFLLHNSLCVYRESSLPCYLTDTYMYIATICMIINMWTSLFLAMCYSLSQAPENLTPGSQHVFSVYTYMYSWDNGLLIIDCFGFCEQHLQNMIIKACLHGENNVHWMRINLKWLRPHGIRIEPIRIETRLSQSTYRGGLNAHCDLNPDWCRHNLFAHEAIQFARNNRN